VTWPLLCRIGLPTLSSKQGPIPSRRHLQFSTPVVQSPVPRFTAQPAWAWDQRLVYYYTLFYIHTLANLPVRCNGMHDLFYDSYISIGSVDTWPDAQEHNRTQPPGVKSRARVTTPRRDRTCSSVDLTWDNVASSHFQRQSRAAQTRPDASGPTWPDASLRPILLPLPHVTTMPRATTSANVNNNRTQERHVQSPPGTSVWSSRPRPRLSAYTDRTHKSSWRQRPVTHSDLFHFRFFTELIYFNSNFFSFVNVPTPPSVHHNVYMC
jgi:hypothetical protein